MIEKLYQIIESPQIFVSCSYGYKYEHNKLFLSYK